VKYLNEAKRGYKKLEKLRKELVEAAEKRYIAEGILRTSNEVIDQYKMELTACSGAGVQQEWVMEEKAIASKATEEEEEEFEAVVEVETSEEMINMVETQIGLPRPQKVDEVEKFGEVVEKEGTSSKVKDVQKVNEVEESGEVVEEMTFEENTKLMKTQGEDFDVALRAQMKKNDDIMEWMMQHKKKKMEAYEAAFDAQLRKGEDDTGDVSSEGEGVCL